MAAADQVSMEEIVSLAKRRGFVFQGSEIYGGLAGTWDYGPMGVELKRNIEALWWRQFVHGRENMYGLDAATLMHPRVFEASGHLAGFNDPMVSCRQCGQRFRADHLEEDRCPFCHGELSSVKQFNMMFSTRVGAAESEDNVAYLRPETAQGIFTNFKNVLDAHSPKLPFGIAQMGKAYRNEISPRDFLFRVRELEQMEIEYFIRPPEHVSEASEGWEAVFEHWRQAMWQWIDAVGISRERVHELEVPDEELAHYSQRTIDFEYDYPTIGRKELYGLAYRTDYDLRQHAQHSGEKLTYRDDTSGEVFPPHVIEPTFGVGRTILAVLADAYTRDTVGDDERTYLALRPAVAPVKAAVFPLLKNKPQLQEKAGEVYRSLKQRIPQTAWDDNGNIGKRYRRQDEIGTPLCITIDFDTLEDETVTVRDRDSGEQERVALGELEQTVAERLGSM